MGDSNIRRNLPELFEVVRDDYLNGLYILCFCATLENCLKYVRDAQLLICDALGCFEEEDRNGDSRYSNTLEKLRNFRDTGVPLTEFREVFQVIHKQQKSRFEKLQVKKKKINEELKCIRTWAKVFSMIMVATFEAVLINSFMTSAVVAPSVAPALAAAAAFPMELVGDWIDSLWKNYENKVKKEEEVINSMRIRTYVALTDLDTIGSLIDLMEVDTKSLLHRPDFAIEKGPEALKLGLPDIKRKLRDFMKDVEELETQAEISFRGL
ncbi:hypothetical protein BT93_L1155 [Corymbia citriodora subsp. variegata]|uniref:Uncharacterized protein n=1 Tax=Corymbia citriodora subsp. variegata TaxID=360336 RepID=A0A8T0CNE0_CORYI|nr:hypothetical protein BT93_L1155 [Corymbia citriodora subsp. variegata]